MNGNEKVLRGALIGFGFIGSQGHLPSYLKHRGFKIAAIVDECEDRRQWARHIYPHARIYSDTHTMLDQEMPRLDFVDIATPPTSHAPLAAMALESGLHVLC